MKGKVIEDIEKGYYLNDKALICQGSCWTISPFIMSQKRDYYEVLGVLKEQVNLS